MTNIFIDGESAVQGVEGSQLAGDSFGIVWEGILCWLLSHFICWGKPLKNCYPFKAQCIFLKD